ncbi:MAG: NAD(P)-dependent oxidoreductase [Acetobacteraceae bacterium]
MRRVLVTGGAGFIGLSLARALSFDGIAVDLVDNFSRGKSDAELAAVTARPGVRCLTLDLRREGATDALDDNYDAIFHFAALLGVANVIGRPYETLALNVQLTVEALRLARRQKRLSCFLFASTSEVYAGSLLAGHLRFPTPEDAILSLPPLVEPRTSYMLSKLYGEALVRHAGVPGVIVRPHNVYGPRMGLEHVIPELMKRMRTASPGAALPIYSADHSRTFCYIDDAVALIRALAGNPDAEGGAWNVGCEEPEYKILDVAELIRRVLGAPAVLEPAAATAGSPTRRCPSMARTRALTGYQCAVSLEDGVARTYDWYARTVFSVEG